MSSIDGSCVPTMSCVVLIMRCRDFRFAFCAASIPSAYTVCQYASSSESVKVHQQLFGQVSAPQPPLEVKVLLCLTHYCWGVNSWGAVLCDCNPQKLKAGNFFHHFIIYVNWAVCIFPGSPRMHNNFLGLFGVQYQVVVNTPPWQGLHLLLVWGLIVVCNMSNNCYIICELNDGVGVLCRLAVMCKKDIEEGTQHTALWDSSVQSNGRGYVLVRPNCLGAVNEEIQY